MSNSSTVVDLAIIGGGPAGLACAITARDLGLTVVLFEGAALGGELNTLESVNDLPGRPPMSGPDLAADLIDDLVDRGVDVRYEQLTEVEWRRDSWNCGTTGPRATWLVMASGAEIDLSGLDGATAAHGRGVSLCASCDGPLFKGKTVAVLGGGRDAILEAETVANYAARVTMVLTEQQERTLRPTAAARPSENWHRSVVKRVIGVVGAPVEALRVETLRGEVELLEVDAVFPTEPRRPRSGVVGLPIEAAGGAIAVGPDLLAAGHLLAAGDVRAQSSNTVSGAIGDGVAAAWTVLRAAAIPA